MPDTNDTTSDIAAAGAEREDPLAAFTAALGADVVIPLGPPGAMGITDILASRSWFDARQRALREAGWPGSPRESVGGEELGS